MADEASRLRQQQLGQSNSRISWLLTLVLAAALLYATAPSEYSLELYLTTRRDSSTLGQVRTGVTRLWASLVGGGGAAAEQIATFESYGVLSVAEVADGRRFAGVCGIWLEATIDLSMLPSSLTELDLTGALERVYLFLLGLKELALRVGRLGLVGCVSSALEQSAWRLLAFSRTFLRGLCMSAVGRRTRRMISTQLPV